MLAFYVGIPPPLQSGIEPADRARHDRPEGLWLSEPVADATHVEQHLCDSGGFEFLAQILNMGIHDTLKSIAFREALFQ